MIRALLLGNIAWTDRNQPAVCLAAFAAAILALSLEGAVWL